MAIRGQSNERFGAMPLPIELDGRATEGEMMVGRSTGHFYVRNGGKNLSKTVEIEEFLKALRMGALNWVRQGGHFDENLIMQDNWFINTNSGVDKTDKISLVTEGERTFLRVKGYTSADTAKQYYLLNNKLYAYHKAKFIMNKKLAISFMARANTNTTIGFRIANTDSTNSVVGTKDVIITTEWQKFEIIADVVGIGDKPVISFDFKSADVILDLDELQLEPGDRSFAWRPSFYDMIQLMDFKDGELRKDLERQITEAIRECKEYTDTEIEKLGDKFERLVREAIKECKEYTDTEITKVNERIDSEVKESEAKDRNERAHLILGNNDWMKYVDVKDGLSYSAEHRGILVDGARRFELLKEFPVFEDTKYFVRIKVKQLSGTGKFYCGVESLYSDLNSMKTDSQSSYNYFANTTLTNGEVAEFSAIYEGYNPYQPAPGYTNKFDPYASYFRLGFLTNHTGTPGQTVILGVEIFEVPKCLHNALYTAEDNRDGLMSAEEHRKLGTVEWNANNYSHPTGDGNLHVPATGTENDRKVLTAGKTPGSAKWETLPDDIDKVDGKHANEFVWINEQPVVVDGTNVRKVNHPYKNLLNKSTTTSGYLKIVTPVTASNYFCQLKFTVYSQDTCGSTIDIGFYISSQNTFSSVYAFSQNRALTGTDIYLGIENSKICIYVGSSSFRNVVVSIDEFIYYWQNAELRHLEWNSEVITQLPENCTRCSYNSETNAKYFNNRSSDSFADRQGAKVDNYTTPTPDKKVANMNTRGSNENSWLALDPTNTNSNTGIYYNGSTVPIQVEGEKDLPPDTIAHIGENHLQHYHDMKTGDAYHKGNLESHNIQLGNFRIIKNESKKSLDFILD